MDFDDCCYFVDSINKCIANFVQQSLCKDELDDLLGDEPYDGGIKTISTTT